MKKTTIYIKGMHCSSCELLVSDELLHVSGIHSVSVSQRKGTAGIEYQGQLDWNKINAAITNAGYSIGKEEKKPFISTDLNDYVEVAIMIIVFAFLAIIANDSGILKITELTSNNLTSLPVVFLIGLTAGISTCAALVGGLVLGASARFSQQNPHATVLEKFIPHLYFNLGRIISFFILGGLMGVIGSLFQMSLGVMGFFTITIGLVMFVFGTQLTNLFPRLSSWNISIPSSISKVIGLQGHTEKQYSHRNAVVLGALTFFLPCGFTQLVQLYAISTANPITASLTMGVFALGTTPGLLGIGGLTSFIKGAFSRLFFKTVGVMVMALAVFNINNGINLTGIKMFAINAAPSLEPKAAYEPSGEVQNLKAKYSSKDDMVPNSFTVNAGQPVKLDIEVKDDGFGCMGSMALPGLSSQVEMLVKNKPMVFEFTPENPGTYQITCAMGVPRGTIRVL